MNNGKNKLLVLIKPFILKLVFGSILTILVSLLMLSQPILTQLIVDNCIVQGKVNLLGIFILGYLMVFLIGKILTYCKNILFFNISEKFLLHTRDKVHKIMLYTTEMDDTLKENINSHIINELPLLSGSLITLFDDCINNIVTIVMILAVLIKFSIGYSLIQLIICVVTFIILRVYIPKFKYINTEVLNNQAKSMNILAENFANIKVIKYLKIYLYPIQKMNKAFTDEFHTRAKKLKLNIQSDFIISALYYIPPTLCILYSVIMISRKQMTIGQFFLLSNYTATILNPINFFSQFFIQFQNVNNITERYWNFINRYNYDASQYKKVPQLNEFNSIILKNIYFSYEQSKYIFKNLSLSLSSSDKLVIKGNNGTGKTTLLDIILGLKRVCKGDVLINHINVNDISEYEYSKVISAMPQEHCMFNDTIRNNIILNRDINDSEILNIIDKMGIREFFNKNFNLDVIVTRTGDNLSGGQKQLISLIRTLITNSQIIILDEPFNHLDSYMKKKVINYLEKYFNDKLIILITHQETDTQINYKVLDLNSTNRNEFNTI